MPDLTAPIVNFSVHQIGSYGLLAIFILMFLESACIPSPSEANCVTEIEGLPVLTLAQLIQAKLACGLGNLRRTHKDFADVVELIAIHGLDGSFARLLHKSVRKEYRLLVRRASGQS